MMDNQIPVPPPSTSTLVLEDVGDLFFEEGRSNGSPPPPPEGWRDVAQSWGEIFRFLYDGDIKSAASTCFAINKDISFMVGEEMIRAHSFVLQMRSGYFSRAIAKLFDQALKGKGRYQDDQGHQLWDLKPLNIPSSMADLDTFKAIIKFMYTEEIDEVNDEKLVQLVDASKRFEIRLMEKKCKHLLGNRLNPKNAVSICNVAERFKNERLMGRCFEIICKSSAELFANPDFVNLSHSILCKLLASNELNVPENQVFYSTMRWAREQLCKLNLQENGENLRKVLSPAHRLIRFPLLSSEFIVNEVRPLGLLNDTEFAELAIFYLSPNNDALENFCSHPRRFQEQVHEVPSSTADQQSHTNQNHIPQIQPAAMSPNISQQGESTKSAAPFEPLLPLKTKTPPLELPQRLSNSAPSPCTGHITINEQIPLRRRSTDSISSAAANVLPGHETLSICNEADVDIPPGQPNPADGATEISSCSGSEQEDGEVLTTPQPSPMSNSTTSRNRGTESQLDQSYRKRKLSSDAFQSDSKRCYPSSPEGCDRVITLTGSMHKVLTNDDLWSRIRHVLQNQGIDGLHQVSKIILLNVLLPKRRNAKPSIIVPNIRHLEIIFDTVENSKAPAIHPDDYLIFGPEKGVEILLDKGIWQGNMRLSIWENGIRRFEANPVDKTLCVNIDDPSIASHIVKRLAVDLEEDDFIRKLALSCTTPHSKFNPAKLTHLVLHRCKFERTDVLLIDCISLQKLSWVGIFEKDTLDLTHLANASTTLTTLSLCNLNIKVNKHSVPTLTALITIHLVMCKWDLCFEEQFGVFAPQLRRLFIAARHNFIPSDTMTASFLTEMRMIENVVVAFAPPVVIKCEGRIEAGKRFLKCLQSNAIVINTNLSTVRIPVNGFRLRRMGRSWNFLALPAVIPTSKSPGLVDKEYFDFFLLQVFARDAVTYYRETTLECRHSGTECRGRYFPNGNILNLCLHEQSLMDKYSGRGPSCCTSSGAPSVMATTPLNLSQQCDVFNSEVSLNSADHSNLCGAGECVPNSCEQASVCGCSSCLELSTDTPPASPSPCPSLSSSQMSLYSSPQSPRRRLRKPSSRIVRRSSSSSSSRSSSPIVLYRKKSTPLKRVLRSNHRAPTDFSSDSNQAMHSSSSSSSSNRSFRDSNSADSSCPSDIRPSRSRSISPPLTRFRAQQCPPQSSDSSSCSDDDASSRSETNSPPLFTAKTRLTTTSMRTRRQLRQRTRRDSSTSSSSLECISILDGNSNISNSDESEGES